MNKIHPLSQELISKIAAGEVIERPVYAVKELVENSLDAGADDISIHIEDSGLKKITVIDNGIGMSREDLEECFKPHTTSKISSISELSHIATLGFRGEALSSIAAISTMTIKSKQSQNTAGISIALEGGNITKISSTGMPTGTQITVEHLFASIPGRRKFLKSPRTEFRHILEWVTGIALAYPQVQFTLTHNGKIIFDLTKNIAVIPDLISKMPSGYEDPRSLDSRLRGNDKEINDDKLDRIKHLLGADFASHLLPVSYEDSYIKLSGFLAKPHFTASNLHKQFIYINQRRVSDRVISFAVKEAYGRLLPAGTYPVFLLFFALPFETVDVNVHPRKEEVRFINNQLISQAINTAVLQTLGQHNLINRSYWDEETYTDVNEFKDALSAKPDTRSYAGKLLKETKLPWILQTIDEVSGEITQLHNLYLVQQSKYGIIFIDQHAAHERILYEQLLEAFKQQTKKPATFVLHKPLVLDLSFAESEVLKEHIVLFTQMGFAIEHFKDTTFLLHTLPLLFQDRNGKQVIMEMLDDLQQEKKPKAVDTITSRMIAYLACRGAVKAGDKLTKKQAKDLLEQLQKTPNNATCPHGRPVKVEIDLKKINKLFKRI